jgi:hypothetical protein
MPPIDHLAAFAAKLARMSGTTESSVPATAHPLVQTDGSATTVLMEAKATTSGPDATSLQGTFEHEPKLDVFAGTHHAYTLEQVIPGYGIEP